ncbi:hypothetical protein D515_03354 [Grimontia indica]|uniref:Uncharacterized protein n=1 Tax=Grimontia indica TaxID=1056512 RepID=R1IRD7_9GAMM|nr:hypothetical protein D515_03354 [Grimontia indica]
MNHQPDLGNLAGKPISSKRFADGNRNVSIRLYKKFSGVILIAYL